MGFPKDIKVLDIGVSLMNCFSADNRITFSEEKKKKKKFKVLRGAVHMGELHIKSKQS